MPTIASYVARDGVGSWLTANRRAKCLQITENAMTNESIHQLSAISLVVGTLAAVKHRQRRRSLASTLKAARKAGAGHVELIDNKVVIALAGKPPDTRAGPVVSNEWDEVLPGGLHGTD
jgi:hypothetical protein